MPRRVVVTGLGAMSPNGIGKKKILVKHLQWYQRNPAYFKL